MDQETKKFLLIIGTNIGGILMLSLFVYLSNRCLKYCGRKINIIKA